MTRRHYLRLTAGAVLVTGNTLAKPNDNFVVIVHPSNRFDSLSCSKVSFLFLRKVSRWPWGAEAFPIDAPPPSSLRRIFTQQVLRTSEEQLAAYWIDQQTTTGLAPPVVAVNAAVAKALVAAKPGAIAYILASEVDSTVKVIRVEL